MRAWDDALDQETARLMNERASLEQNSAEMLDNGNVTFLQLLQGKAIEILDQVISMLKAYQSSKDLGSILEDIKRRCFIAWPVGEDLDMSEAHPSPLIRPAELTDRVLDMLSMAWQLISSDKLQVHHFMKLTRLEEFAQIYWGSQRWEASKSHWRALHEKDPTPMSTTREQNEQIQKGEVTYQRLLQREGILRLDEQIGRLKDSAGAIGAGKILEGSRGLYMDDARTLEDMMPVTRDNADEKLAQPLDSKLILAHRLFLMADGETSARAIFLTRFCRMILGKEDLQKSVNETEPELHATYSDEEIAENTEKGRAVAYLYRVEATELVKEVRRRFMEFDMTMVETLGWDNTDTDF